MTINQACLTACEAVIADFSLAGQFCPYKMMQGELSSAHEHRTTMRLGVAI
jgi:hypothetical protein